VDLLPHRLPVLLQRVDVVLVALLLWIACPPLAVPELLLLLPCSRQLANELLGYGGSQGRTAMRLLPR